MTTKSKAAGGQAETRHTEQAKPPVEEAVRRGIDAFIAQHLRNSDFSRDTAAWNHFQAGLPVLTGCIVNALEG